MARNWGTVSTRKEYCMLYHVTASGYARQPNSVLPPEPHPLVARALLCCTTECFFWQAVFCVDRAVMVSFLVVCLRGWPRRLRDWACWVSFFTAFEFICMKLSPRRNGPPILWLELPHLPQCIPNQRMGKCVHSLSFNSVLTDMFHPTF